MPRLLRTAALLVLICAFASRSRAAQFTINYNGAPAEAQTAVQFAADIWGDILVSSVPIKVLVNWAPLGATALGVTFPNGRRDFTDAPLASTWYATSLANAITSTELNVGENDFEVWLSSSANWYMGTDAQPGAGQYDLVSVVLHEFAHGLGFVGLSKKEGTTGSLGLLQMSDFSPLFTTFPWPQLDTLPGVFDRFLSDAQSGALTLMANPGTQLGSAQTGNQLYFNGPLVMAENNGNAPRIYAPNAFALGSSCVHLNESTYPAGNPNELMTPFSTSGDANHWPGPLCLAMLRDIGWTLAPDVGIAEARARTEITAYPNPAHELLSLRLSTTPTGSMRLMDAQGRVVRSMSAATIIDVHDLEPGPYVLVLNSSATAVRFIKE